MLCVFPMRNSSQVFLSLPCSFCFLSVSVNPTDDVATTSLRDPYSKTPPAVHDPMEVPLVGVADKGKVRPFFFLGGGEYGNIRPN